MKTREKILKEALILFSERGFHAVSVRDIAKAVGIKESSLYNHFKNKQDIFDSIVDIQWENAKAYFREKELPFAPEEKKDVFIERDFDRLSEKVLSVFSFFFENEENVRYRRLLILSQYEYPRAKEIYIQLYRNYNEQLSAGSLAKCSAFSSALPFPHIIPYITVEKKGLGKIHGYFIKFQK